jgi:hypothetical protein
LERGGRRKVEKGYIFEQHPQPPLPTGRDLRIGKRGNKIKIPLLPRQVGIFDKRGLGGVGKKIMLLINKIIVFPMAMGIINIPKK